MVKLEFAIADVNYTIPISLQLPRITSPNCN